MPLLLITVEYRKTGFKYLIPLTLYDLMLYQLLLNMFSSWVPGTKDDERGEDKRTILSEANDERSAPVVEVEQNPLTEDIKRLDAEYGPLTEGMSLTVELKHLLVLCPRSRRRKDSYKKLQKVLLRDKGVILTIKSQKG